MIEYTDYRLALIVPASRQLLGMRCPAGIELSLARIPLWERPAEQLTKELENRWKIKAIVLDLLASSGFRTPCAVIEVRTESWDFGAVGLCAAQLDDIGDVCLEESQRASLKSILNGDDAGRGVFSRIGWIEEGQRWIQSSIRDREITFSGDIRQLNGGGSFCLLRIGTQSGPSYWIKGVGAPNAHEFGITSYLARHVPGYLPPIIAMRADWNAWAMEEFGASLHGSNSLDDFTRAIQKLANLQISLLGKSEEMLDIHFADHRLATLGANVDAIIDYLDDAMRQQTSTRVAPLSVRRLQEIRRMLHAALSALQARSIPDTLLHGDISPGSILGNEYNCVFTDWCEGGVGNPFITAEQLCVHVRRTTSQPRVWMERLRSSFKSAWLGALTEHQIEGAFSLVPLISVLSYLYGRGDWLNSPRRDDPNFQSYSRSLARHMDRIAGTSELIEAIC